MINYFQIIEEENYQLISLINKQRIQRMQFFPVYGFSTICKDIENIDKLKKQQIDRVNSIIEKAPTKCKGTHNKPDCVLQDPTISSSHKVVEIVSSIINRTMDLTGVERFLCSYSDKNSTNYKKILCAYDLRRYSNEIIQ